MIDKDRVEKQFAFFKKNHAVMPYNPEKKWTPDLWLVEDMFLSGGKINFIFGQPKAGKSRFALWLVANMVGGKYPFGLRVDKPIDKVMWLLGEETIRNMQWRLTRYAVLIGIDPMELKDKVIWVEGANMSLERKEKRDQLYSAIRTVNPDLTVLDPFRRFHNASEQGSDPAISMILNTFREWTKKLHTDLMPLHHTGKLSIDAEMTQISTWARGTSDIAAILDSAVFLQRFGRELPNAGSEVTLHRGGRHAPDDALWRFYDLGRSDKDDPANTDLGWKFKGKK